MSQNSFVVVVTLLAGLFVVLYKKRAGYRKNLNFLIEKNQQLLQEKDLLQAENTRLEKQHTINSRLFSIISHDVRGPLHVIKGLVSLLGQSEMTSDDLKKYCRVLTTNLEASIHLVENILQWSRSQLNGIHSQPFHFDLALVIEEVIEQLHTQASNKQILVKFIQVDLRTKQSLAASSLVRVYADPVMIEIAIRNLLTNAIKFSKSGDVVIVGTQSKADFIELFVQDKGPGIAKEAQVRLFQMDSPFSTTGTANEKGSGLGLAFCKEMIEKNGGTIRCESVYGNGATFFFTVPKSK
ncbi:HAMP domain-containing sensor histidine kinase [Xanthocytophaga agilis]|uniref:histidine kinase n=1 Tax=Xanthocytophaga agilis TaxID=3048010 RepID=A0AAE3RAG0_9BACT|nr:HAMP domain-containing sensor histidine kinase [Xanthocytophaga agilis]MDJ1506654.1 HAMP domain-containing sensor histidine kinase [Xanthocytophaga agilis]